MNKMGRILVKVGWFLKRYLIFVKRIFWNELLRLKEENHFEMIFLHLRRELE